MRTFKFQVLIDGEEVGKGQIAIDQSVIDEANSEEFKRDFYTFHSDDDIAAHIARSMVLWREKLSQLEGFMMPDELAQITEFPHGYNNFEFEAQEVR